MADDYMDAASELRVAHSQGRLSTNGILEDLAAEIGYTATGLIEIWFGGQSLWIPTEATPGHPIEVIIGEKAFARLVRFADDLLGQYGRVLNLPLDSEREVIKREKMVVSMLCMGKGTKEVARICKLTEAQILKIRRWYERAGLIPMILKDAQWRPGKRTPQSQMHMKLVFEERRAGDAND